MYASKDTVVNSDLNKKICDYFRFLKLSLPDKTKFILFTKSNEGRNLHFKITSDFNNDGGDEEGGR